MVFSVGVRLFCFHASDCHGSASSPWRLRGGPGRTTASAVCSVAPVARSSRLGMCEVWVPADRLHVTRALPEPDSLLTQTVPDLDDSTAALCTSLAAFVNGQTDRTIRSASGLHFVLLDGFSRLKVPRWNPGQGRIHTPAGCVSGGNGRGRNDHFAPPPALSTLQNHIRDAVIGLLQNERQQITDWSVCGFDEGVAVDRKAAGREPLVVE